MDELMHRDAAPGPLAGDDFVDAMGGDDEDPPAAPPEEAPEPEKQPEPEKEPEPEAEPDATPETTAKLLEGMNAVLEELKRKNADEETTDEPGPEPVPVPAYLAPLLEHDDPAVRESAQAILDEHRQLNERMDRVENAAREAEIERVGQALDVFIANVSSQCDPPLTEKEQSAVIERMTDETNGPALARSLDFRDGVNLVFPGRLKSAPRTDTPPADPKKGSEGSRPVVKVVDRRPGPRVETPGGPAARSPAVRPENESLRQTVDRVFDEVFK